MSKPDKFRFKRLDSIGAAAAEEDKTFLQQCFVATSHLSVLLDCKDPRSVVLGRTGSGKTALLQKLAEDEPRTIEIRPESLALAYISNSTILTFLAELGVKLDIFFRLLWRHVFTVELLKCHFEITNEDSRESFLLQIRGLFRNRKDQQAIEYLERWGKSFWEETEFRIKEVTTNLENNVKDSIKSVIPTIRFSTEEISALSEQQRQEVINRAQYVVNQVQIRQLSEIIDLIDNVLSDPQKRYYLTIDRLDEDWIEDRLRYRLIRALIETVRDFRKVRNAKLVVAMRYDLLDRVFRLTRDAGFQEEKYESLFLPLEWTPEQLTYVLDQRIDYMVRQRYTSQRVSHKDILPERIRGQWAIDYMLRRTLMRPRDIILFFNKCIAYGTDRAIITGSVIKQAEGEYSRERLRALADEWFADYPNLLDFVALLKGREWKFRLTEIAPNDCEEFCLNWMTGAPDHKDDALGLMATQVAHGNLDANDFRRTLFQILYRVGLVGLKTESFQKFNWVVVGRVNISPAEITEKTIVSVHPAFWRVLGIVEA